MSPSTSRVDEIPGERMQSLPRVEEIEQIPDERVQEIRDERIGPPAPSVSWFPPID
jgi:hypothetical protein